MVRISVVVPTYKRLQFLKDTIQSVLDQSFRDFELIIVDDNGVGTVHQKLTQALISEFSFDKRIKYIPLIVNGGGSAARNVGWQAACGYYVCFLDNDDLFYPKKLEIQYNLLYRSGISASVCRFESLKGNRVVSTSLNVNVRSDYLSLLLCGKINFAAGSTLMVEKAVLKDLNGFDEEFRRKQDIEFMVRLLHSHSLMLISDVLVGLRVDDRSNIPTVGAFLETQNIFSKKFEPIISSFPYKLQRDIKEYDLIELSKVCLWNKQYIMFFKLFFCSNISLVSKVRLFFDLINKLFIYKF